MIDEHAPTPEASADPMVAIRAIAEGLAPSRPFDRCIGATGALVSALAAAGVVGERIRLRGHRIERPEADRRWRRLDQSGWTHYAVNVPDMGMTIDPTWRQFDRTGPSVLIETTDAYDAMWTMKEKA